MPRERIDLDPIDAVSILDEEGRVDRALEPAIATAGHAPPLAAVARRLGLPSHRPHTADGDALTTAQVFLALGAHLDRRNKKDARVPAPGSRDPHALFTSKSAAGARARQLRRNQLSTSTSALSRSRP